MASRGLARSFIFLSVPGQNNESWKLHNRCKTTCLNVKASIFMETVGLLDRISAVRLLLNFLAFSFTFLAGKNYRRSKLLKEN